MPNLIEMSMKGHSTEQRAGSDVFSVIFTPEEKKKHQKYDSAAIQLKGEKMPKSMPSFAKMSQTLSY